MNFLKEDSGEFILLLKSGSGIKFNHIYQHKKYIAIKINNKPIFNGWDTIYICQHAMKHANLFLVNLSILIMCAAFSWLLNSELNFVADILLMIITIFCAHQSMWNFEAIMEYYNMAMFFNKLEATKRDSKI